MSNTGQLGSTTTNEVSEGLRSLPSGFEVGKRTLGVIWMNKRARVGIIILAFFVGMGVLAPWLSPYAPDNATFARNQGVSAAHWLGTTGAGEDVLSQIMYGTQISLLVGLVAGGGVSVIAVIVGLTAGYLKGWRTDVINFFINLFLVIPSLPLMIVITTYVPGQGILVIIAVIAFTGWAAGSRVLRSQTQTLRSRDFIDAAIFSGEGRLRILFREIMPNMTSLIAASFFGAATAAIGAEAGLSFLGLGDLSTISWGTMLYWAQNNNALLTGQWALLVAPGLCVALLATSLALINFGIDAVSNPRLRESTS
ncbi:ABC transporter permease [Paramicrobacterium fandaimingii]|uniref:ABC transporter permease n=1 Tax=Paramicrobacterium fandaimingii TaxID=2708079 RepID=UPI001420358F|nr:ABC transporter permease [Microbacterium fandaimingii]